MAENTGIVSHLFVKFDSAVKVAGRAVGVGQVGASVEGVRMVRAVDALKVGKVASVQFQGAVLVVLHCVAGRRDWPVQPRFRVVPTKNTRCIGEVPLMQRARYRKVARCPVGTGQVTTGHQGVERVGALKPLEPSTARLAAARPGQSGRRLAGNRRRRPGCSRSWGCPDPGPMCPVRAGACGRSPRQRGQSTLNKGFSGRPSSRSRAARARAWLTASARGGGRPGRRGGNGLDKPMDGNRPGSQGDQAIGVQQG